MDNRSESTTHIGLGFATRADAFQAGREAAQMARQQVPEGDPELVLVFGPGDARLNDFIEGVRLVTGEETLIGVPVRRVISPDVSAANACATLIIRSNAALFSIAGAPVEADRVVPAATSLFSQIRQQRGNTHHAFDCRGVLMFENTTAQSQDALAEEMSTDAGLESWLLGSVPVYDGKADLVCRNRALEHGAVAVECLSNTPWGIGTVGLGAFQGRPDIHREAVRSAMRAARQEIGDAKPALGLLFLDFSISEFDENDLLDLLECAISVAPNTPLLGIPTASHFSRSADRPVLSHRESVTALLVPE